ncbi:hypothetical protein CsatA_017731 [Cannabis sativa]
MKFEKEFASQMVPEWQEAYTDYKFLKEVLKQILRFRQRTSTVVTATTPEGSLSRNVSLYREFSGLTNRYRSNTLKLDEDQVILVNPVHQQQQQGSESEFEELELEYQTMFMMSTDDGGEYEVVFFKRLDDEFNKVVNFYRKKVKQVLEEADELTRQMNVLIALRIKVENPVFKFGEDDVMNIASKGVSLSDHPQPLNDQKPERQHMDAIQEVERSCEEEDEEEEGRISNESKGSSGSKESNEKKEHKKGVKGFRPASLDVLDNVKINVAPETPISTLRGILMTSTSDFSFSREELKKSEELMKQAFTEFYQKLRLLKSYCLMNQLAFSKIMKKYDKISTRSAAKAYLEMVDESYLGRSDEVSKLMERVEVTFIKHFANGNQAKGMNTLRPKTKRERRRTTFLLANIYFWRKYQINYPLIFGLKQGTDLGYRQVFLLSAGLSVLSLGAVISNLDMKIDPRTRSFDLLPELVPVGLVVALLVILVLPFNILYRSTRYFLIVSAFHCLFAPLYKVSLADFFLADQLTSQVQAFRSLEFYVCYYFWGDFTKRQHKCLGNDVYKAFNLVVAIIPYWFRLLQCMRRLLEEKDGMQGLNGLKYFSTIIAVSMRTLFDSKKGLMRFLTISSSVIATIASTYWDLVIDWGLLRRDSKNPWLRDKLILQQKSIYFVAMVVNVVLRLAWMQTVLQFNVDSLHPNALIAIVASLEIIRRGIWNFFRIENEHLNNVGKYRAFKSVPLPFNYDDENDEKEE